jgi:hypothetical protein
VKRSTAAGQYSQPPIPPGPTPSRSGSVSQRPYASAGCTSGRGSDHGPHGAGALLMTIGLRQGASPGSSCGSQCPSGRASVYRASQCSSPGAHERDTKVTEFVSKNPGHRQKAIRIHAKGREKVSGLLRQPHPGAGGQFCRPGDLNFRPHARLPAVALRRLRLGARLWASDTAWVNCLVETSGPNRDARRLGTAKLEAGAPPRRARSGAAPRRRGHSRPRAIIGR